MWYACILLFAAVLPFSLNAQSCCTSNAASNWSVMPNLDKHVVGVRYTYRSFKAVYPRSLNPEWSGRTTHETMHTAEVFGRFNIANRLQLTAMLPVTTVMHKEENVRTATTGMGDMSLLLQYAVLKNRNCSLDAVKQQFRIGVGVKLPSGQYNPGKNNRFATNLQLGSGSIDFTAGGLYTLRHKQAGVNASVQYRHNTVNAHGYRFGDRVQAALGAFYVVESGGVTVMPNAGLNSDYLLYNVDSKQTLYYTGGAFLNATAGIDLFYKNVAFSAVYTPTLLKRLNWSGELYPRHSVEVGVYYIFSTNHKNNKT